MLIVYDSLQVTYVVFGSFIVSCGTGIYSAPLGVRPLSHFVVQGALSPQHPTPIVDLALPGIT